MLDREMKREPFQNVEPKFDEKPKSPDENRFVRNRSRPTATVRVSAFGHVTDTCVCASRPLVVRKALSLFARPSIANTHARTPSRTMSAFLGSKIVAKATPVVADRDVTVRAASASECVPPLGAGRGRPFPSKLFPSRRIDIVRASSETPRVRPSLTPPSLPPSLSGVNRRAAVAGVIALFASAAASPANGEE